AGDEHAAVSWRQHLMTAGEIPPLGVSKEEEKERDDHGERQREPPADRDSDGDRERDRSADKRQTGGIDTKARHLRSGDLRLTIYVNRKSPNRKSSIQWC